MEQSDIERAVLAGSTDEMTRVVNLVSKRRSPSPTASPSSQETKDKEDDFFQITPVHLAAGRGDVAMLEALHGMEFMPLQNMDLGNVVSKDSRGQTPLHHAAGSTRGHLAIDGLLDAGSDINAQDERGRTPAHVALYHGRKKSACLLLATERLSLHKMTLVDKLDHSIFELVVSSGYFRLAQDMYEHGWSAETDAWVDARKLRLLEYFIHAVPTLHRSSDDKDAFRSLFKSFLSLNRKATSQITFSCGRGLFELLAAMFFMVHPGDASDEGIDMFKESVAMINSNPNIETIDPNKYTNGCIWTVSCSICHERLSLSDSLQYHKGHTCLSRAAAAGWTKVCLALLHFTETYCLIGVSKLQDPIAMAAKYGHTNTVEALLNTKHPIFEDYTCTNALYNAALYGHLDTVRLLIDKRYQWYSVGPALRVAVRNLKKIPNLDDTKQQVAQTIVDTLLGSFRVDDEETGIVVDILSAMGAGHGSTNSFLSAVACVGDLSQSMWKAHGPTILACAARSRRLSEGMAKTFVNANSSLPHDERGWLPMHYLAWYGQGSLLFELCDVLAGNDGAQDPMLLTSTEPDNIDGLLAFVPTTPLEILAFRGWSTILESYFTRDTTMELSTAMQVNIARRAGKSGDQSTVNAVLAQVPSARLVVLEAAAMAGHCSIMTNFMRTIELPFTTTFGPFEWSALHVGAFYGNCELVQDLIAHAKRVDEHRLPRIINAKDIAGYTPILLAKALGHYNIVNHLRQIPGIDMESQSKKIRMLWKYITHTSEPPKPNLPDSAYAGIRFSYEPDEECLHGKVLKYHLPIETETGDGLFEVLCPNYDSEKIEKKMLNRKDLFRILDAHPYFEYELYHHYFEHIDESKTSSDTMADKPTDLASRNYEKIQLLRDARKAAKLGKQSMWKEKTVDGVSMRDLPSIGWMNGYSSSTFSLSEDFGTEELLVSWKWRETTLLHLAARRGATNTVKLLLHGGDPTNVPDHRTQVTPLMYALCYERSGITKLLLDYGADPTLACSIPGVSDNITPLQCATETKNGELIQHIRTALEAWDTGASLDVQDKPSSGAPATIIAADQVDEMPSCDDLELQLQDARERKKNSRAAVKIWLEEFEAREGRPPNMEERAEITHLFVAAKTDSARYKQLQLQIAAKTAVPERLSEDKDTESAGQAPEQKANVPDENTFGGAGPVRGNQSLPASAAMSVATSTSSQPRPPPKGPPPMQGMQMLPRDQVLSQGIQTQQSAARPFPRGKPGALMGIGRRGGASARPPPRGMPRSLLGGELGRPPPRPPPGRPGSAGLRVASPALNKRAVVRSKSAGSQKTQLNPDEMTKLLKIRLAESHDADKRSVGNTTSSDSKLPSLL